MTVRENISSMIKKRINEDKIITQANLASELGVSRSAVNKMISKGQIDLNRIIQLCTILKITPNELLGYSNNDNDREILDIINNDSNLKSFILNIKNNKM